MFWRVAGRNNKSLKYIILRTASFFLFLFCSLFLPDFAHAQLVTRRHAPVVFSKNQKLGVQEVRDAENDTLVARYRKIREDFDLAGKRKGDPYICTDTVGRAGAIDAFGNVFIPFEYDYIFPFYKGIAIVERDGARGIINYKNQVLLPFEYDEIVLNRVYYGLTEPKAYNLLVNWNIVLVRKGTRWYWKSLQNELLNIVNPPPFDWDGGRLFYKRTNYHVQYFEENDRSFVFYAGKRSFSDARFNGYKINEIRKISDDDYGLRDNRDSLTISFPNDTLQVFLNYTRFKLANDTLILLGNRNFWQVFNDNFKTISERYDKITPVGMTCTDWRMEFHKQFDDQTINYNLGKNAYFIVENKNKKGVLNLKGELIIPIIYDNIQPFFKNHENHENYILLEKNKTYGIADVSGQIWLPPYASTINWNNPNLEWIDIWANDKYSAFNTATHQLLPFINYRCMHEFSDDNHIAISYNNETIIYNRKAEKVISFTDSTSSCKIDEEGIMPVDTGFYHRFLHLKQLKKALPNADFLRYPMSIDSTSDSLKVFDKDFKNIFSVRKKRAENTFLHLTQDSILIAVYKNKNGIVKLIAYSIAQQKPIFVIDPARNYMIYNNEKDCLHLSALHSPPYIISLKKFNVDSVTCKQVKIFSPSTSSQQSLLIATNSDNFYGAINAEGKIIVPFKYDAIRLFSEGYTRFRLNWQCGYVDKNGAEPIAQYFDYAEDISNKRALVFKDGVWFFLKL